MGSEEKMGKPNMNGLALSALEWGVLKKAILELIQGPLVFLIGSLPSSICVDRPQLLPNLPHGVLVVPPTLMSVLKPQKNPMMPLSSMAIGILSCNLAKQTKASKAGFYTHLTKVLLMNLEQIQWFMSYQ